MKLCYFNAVVHTETKNSLNDEIDQGVKNHSESAKGEDLTLIEEVQPMKEAMQMQVLNKRKRVTL